MASVYPDPETAAGKKVAKQLKVPTSKYGYLVMAYNYPYKFCLTKEAAQLAAYDMWFGEIGFDDDVRQDMDYPADNDICEIVVLDAEKDFQRMKRVS